MIFLVGGSGRLGSAIVRVYTGAPVTVIPRAIYSRWVEPGATREIATYFSQWSATESVIYVTAGLLDPRLPAEDHVRINVTLPLNIVAAACPLGIKVRTFGTIMESLASGQNPYVRSKVALGQAMANAAAAGAPVAHVRIHTLYGGGEPASFMFLGQIIAALRQRSSFRMTQGRQLREYHHVDDDASALRELETDGLVGLVDLSHGSPLSLRELAENIFNTFGANHLLELGALPEPADDNFGTVMERPPGLRNVSFRDARTGVVDYLASYILPFDLLANNAH